MEFFLNAYDVSKASDSLVKTEGADEPSVLLEEVETQGFFYLPSFLPEGMRTCLGNIAVISLAHTRLLNDMCH